MPVYRDYYTDKIIETPSLSAAAAKADDGQQIRADERARVKAILTVPEAEGNPRLAHHFAFHTDISAADAVAGLKVDTSAKVDASEHLSAGAVDWDDVMAEVNGRRTTERNNHGK